jgi:hypothetical protein
LISIPQLTSVNFGADHFMVELLAYGGLDRRLDIKEPHQNGGLRNKQR